MSKRIFDQGANSVNHCLVLTNKIVVQLCSLAVIKNHLNGTVIASQAESDPRNAEALLPPEGGLIRCA